MPYLIEVHRAAAYNTVASTETKLVMDTEDSDVPGWWDAGNTRFLPNVAGNYAMIFKMRTQTAGQLSLFLYKNGAKVGQISPETISQAYSEAGMTIVNLNGTTDYIEPYYNAGTVRALDVSLANLNYLQIFGPF